MTARFLVLLAAITLGLVPSADASPEGDVLVAELGCPACHVDLEIATDVRAKAPSLADAGERYRASYLYDFLRAPRRVRRHIGRTRMPDFGLSEREALALTLFLGEQRAAPEPLPDLPAALDGDVAPEERLDGEAEFQALAGDEKSCLACHARSGRGGTLGPDLADMGARLQSAWMRRFLAAPGAWGIPDGVMPALFLRPDATGRLAEVEPGSTRQVARLVDYLERTAEPERARLGRAWEEARARHPDVTVHDGEHVFAALGCVACHRGADGVGSGVEAAPDLGIESKRVREPWLRSYLAAPHAIRPFGTRPGSGARMPDFRLTSDEADRIADWLLEIGRSDVDASTVDASTVDASTVDASSVDASDVDARTVDASTVDASTVDASTVAASTVDASDVPPAPLGAHRRETTRRLLEEKLPCLGCHRLDGRGGRIGPDLTAARERLRPEFVARMIDDPQATVAHVTMPRVPLGAGERDRLADFLLAEGEPPPPTEYLSVLDHPTIALPREAGAAHDYALYCAPCHGATGEGDGFNARYLPSPPTRHADATVLRERADDTLFDGIHGGGAILDRSHLMPAWGETLSNERIAALVGYLRELCDCDGPAWARAVADGDEPASPPPTPRDVGDASAPEARPSPLAPFAAHEPVVRNSTFDDFLGAEACAECHAAEYDRWRDSTHGHAGGTPDEIDVIARFDGEPIRFRDGVVVPTRTEDGRWVFEVRQDGQPEREIEVAAVVGAGRMFGGGTQSFFAALPDGTVRMLPFDFIRDESTWFVQRRADATWTPAGPDVALADLEHWPPHRALGTAPRLVNCENCHASQILVGYDAEKNRWDTRRKSLRIDCEACHGPGREHLAWARSADRETQADARMESLGLLDKRASVQVCFRCHANKAVIDASFLAGEDFEAHFALKLPVLAQSPHLVDGRVNLFGYQDNHLFSDCFVEGSMVCADCHDPHSQTYRDVHGRPLEGRFDDGQCTGCHAAKARDVTAHTHHPADSEGSRCTSCHMPFLQHQGVGRELRFARSDHSIPIPRPLFDESIGIESACANCHPQKSAATLQAEVDAWWAPIKPHHPMIERTLAARTIADRATAADLLLVPDERHTVAQLAALSTFVRTHLRPDDETLEPEIRAKLEALARNDDLDVAAVALAALHIANGTDPSVRIFLESELTRRGPKATALRKRWRYALHDLSRLHEKADPATAKAIREKLNDVPPIS
ncbi:MAG: c-type cytochrome [Deltaproteobacteria bacterium]|nr:c-type cytochrome [Deltaproteobacteria bacterium]